MKKKSVHINWGACGDWNRVRRNLKFLNTSLFANFCDVEGYVSEIKQKLEKRGFKVIQEENYDKRPLLQLTDADVNTLPNSRERLRSHK